MSIRKMSFVSYW